MLKPTKPSETIVTSSRTSVYCKHRQATLADLLRAADYLQDEMKCTLSAGDIKLAVYVNTEGYGGTEEILLDAEKSIKNPKYALELKKYEEAVTKYNEFLAEEAKKGNKKRRELYEQLKAEFGEEQKNAK